MKFWNEHDCRIFAKIKEILFYNRSEKRMKVSYAFYSHWRLWSLFQITIMKISWKAKTAITPSSPYPAPQSFELFISTFSWYRFWIKEFLIPRNQFRCGNHHKALQTREIVERTLEIPTHTHKFPQAYVKLQKNRGEPRKYLVCLIGAFHFFPIFLESIASIHELLAPFSGFGMNLISM